MKKILIFMLVAVFTISLAAMGIGCKEGATSPEEAVVEETVEEETTAVEETVEEETTAAAETDEDIVIGYTVFNVGANSYTTSYDKALRDQVAELGIECIILDPKGDASVQTNQVEDLITKNVDVIIIWPVSGEAIIPSCKLAQEEGIPIIIANSPLDYKYEQYFTSYCGPDNILEARQAGEMMIEALGGKGNVVELTGLPGYVTTIERHEGFVEAIKDTEIQLIDSQPADWNTEKAQKVMETYLQKYPEQIDGVYGADDGICAGVMNALEAVGMNDGTIKITSPTLFGVGWDAIKEGKLYGSVFQSPILDALITINTAYKLAKGEEVPKANVFDTPKVTKENVDEFERPSW